MDAIRQIEAKGHVSMCCPGPLLPEQDARPAGVLLFPKQVISIDKLLKMVN